MATTHPRRTLRLLAVVALSAALFASSGSAGAQSAGTDFASTGPFSVGTYNGSNHTYFHPTPLGQGVQHPVILWGNGTGASPSGYENLLSHWASHGFIVVAANTPNAGSGIEMRTGLDNLESLNGLSFSRFYQSVDTSKVATSGHSQGGVGALAAARDDNRIPTAMPVQGAFSSAGVSVPILFMSGQNDGIATPSSIYNTFSNASAPSAYAEVAGAGHFAPAGSGSHYRALGAAWASWQLKGDDAARGWFVGSGCVFCTDSQISRYDVNTQFEAAFGPADPGDPGGPGGECVRSSTRSHVSNDRAVAFFGTAYARGSGDNLGSHSFFNFVSLQQTGPNAWTQVSSC